MVQTDAVVLTSGNRRKAVLMHLDEKALLAQPGLRTALALSLLEDHALRLGRAARLAGMASGDFIRYLSRLGITTVKGARGACTTISTISMPGWRDPPDRST